MTLEIAFIVELFICFGMLKFCEILVDKAKEYKKEFSAEFFKSLVDNFGIEKAAKIISTIFEEMVAKQDHDDVQIKEILADVRTIEKTDDSHRSRSRTPPRSRSHTPPTFSFIIKHNVYQPMWVDVKKSAEIVVQNVKNKNNNIGNCINWRETFDKIVNLFEKMIENGMSSSIKVIRFFPDKCTLAVTSTAAGKVFAFRWSTTDMHYNHHMITVLVNVHNFISHLTEKYKAYTLLSQQDVLITVNDNGEPRQMIIQAVRMQIDIEKFIGFYMDGDNKKILIEASSDVEFLEKLDRIY